MCDDQQLLAKLDTDEKRQALSELADRYIDFVYATALRQTRDSHLAEDVTQGVFMVLARKGASLGRRVILTGWLFNAVRYAVANELKKQRRREFHERRAAQMRLDTITPADRHSALNSAELQTALDGAITHLRTTDREALLLHYFRGLSLRQTGETFGISEDAARKRCARAVGKLRTQLETSGVTCTTAVLVALFNESTSTLAPLTLKSAVMSAATQSAGNAGAAASIAQGVIQMMNWTTAKLVAGTAAAVLFAGGAGIVAIEYAGAQPTASIGAPLQAPAPAIKPLGDWFEVQGCRLVQAVTLRPASKPAMFAKASMNEETILQIEWQLPAELMETVQSLKVAAIALGPDQIAALDQAGKPADTRAPLPHSVDQTLASAMSDPTKVSWMVSGIAKETQAIRYGTSPATQSGAENATAAVAKAPKLVPGEYLLGLYVYEKSSQGGAGLQVAQDFVRLTVNPLPNTQIAVDDFQPDGTIRFTTIIQHLNMAGRPQSTLQFMNSDFVKVTKMATENGDEIRFTQTHKGSTYQYRATLPRPVPAGEAMIYRSEGSQSGLITKGANGVSRYSFRHFPGGSDTRRVEIIRLPKGATVLAAIPKEMKRRIVDGRTEFQVDEMVESGKGIMIQIVYK